MTSAQVAEGFGRKFLTAGWRRLAMLNYRVDPAVLKPLVPQGTELDDFAGDVYISMVGFLFLDTRLLGLPIPFHRNFEEVNLRFYVRRETAGELRRGVCFVKELVPRWAIACVARWMYNENYEALPMRHDIDEDKPSPRVAYEWRHFGRWNALRIVADGESRLPAPGSQEEFIAEHYYGYCAQRDGGTIEYRVEHPPWNVWQAADAQLDCAAESLYGSEYAEVLSRPPDSAFLADGSAVAVYRPQRIA